MESMGNVSGINYERREMYILFLKFDTREMKLGRDKDCR